MAERTFIECDLCTEPGERVQFQDGREVDPNGRLEPRTVRIDLCPYCQTRLLRAAVLALRCNNGLISAVHVSNHIAGTRESETEAWLKTMEEIPC